MKLSPTLSRAIPAAFSVLSFVFIGLSFLFHDNFILLAVGLAVMSLNFISTFVLQPKSEKKENPLFAGFFILLIIALAVVIGYLRASKIVF